MSIHDLFMWDYLGDADAKNNPSVMVVKCPILNYHVLVDDIL